MAIQDAGQKKPTGILTKVRTDYLAGAAAGDHTLTGIETIDFLVKVTQIILLEGAPNTFDTPVDISDEFTITATDTINNATGTDTTGDLLAIEWYDRDFLEEDIGFVAGESGPQ